jgi:hypothetical protein
MTTDDGLTIIENEDGSLELEWDSNDSRWSVLNDLTAEEIRAMLMEQISIDLAKLEHD